MAAVAADSVTKKKLDTQQKLQYMCTEIFFFKFAVILMILVSV